MLAIWEEAEPLREIIKTINIKADSSGARPVTMGNNGLEGAG